MCQLTLFDIQDGLFVNLERYIRNQLIYNAYDGHIDGFGYYLWKTSKTYKRGVPFNSWIVNNHNKFVNDVIESGYSGMFHVRMASQVSRLLGDQYAHPHIVENLVLFHNGTVAPVECRFTLDLFKTIWKDHKLSDTQMVALLLNEQAKGVELTPEIIKDTMEYFSGAFNLFVYQKDCKHMWIVRGQERPLYKATIFLNKKPVGIIINSKQVMLDINTDVMLVDNWDNETSVLVTEVPINNIYRYDFGSYNIVPVLNVKEYMLSTSSPKYDYVKEAHPVTVQSLPATVQPEGAKDIYSSFALLVPFFSIFSLDELYYLFYIFNDSSSLFLACAEEVRRFCRVLSILLTANDPDKQRVWNSITEYTGDLRLEVYIRTQLEFPFMLSSLIELKKVLYAIEQEIDNAEHKPG